MPHGLGRPVQIFDNWAEQVTLAVDVNAATATATLNVFAFSRISIQAVADTGTFTTAVLTVQESNDGVTWKATAVAVTGPDTASGAIDGKFARVLVTTLQGGAGTADVFVVAKR